MKYFCVHAILLNYVGFFFLLVSRSVKLYRQNYFTMHRNYIFVYVAFYIHKYVRSLCDKKFQENSCLFPLSVGRKTEEGTGVAVERKIGGKSCPNDKGRLSNHSLEPWP